MTHTSEPCSRSLTVYTTRSDPCVSLFCSFDLFNSFGSFRSVPFGSVWFIRLYQMMHSSWKHFRIGMITEQYTYIFRLDITNLCGNEILFSWYNSQANDAIDVVTIYRCHSVVAIIFRDVPSTYFMRLSLLERNTKYFPPQLVVKKLSTH